MSRLLSCSLLLALACDTPEDKPFVGGGGDLEEGEEGSAGDGGEGTDGGGDGAEDLPPLQESCSTAEEGDPISVAGQVLVGQATWTLDFNEAAEAAGYSDCSYSRTFEGDQLIDKPWLCPDCELITRGTATMTEGTDCYAQLSGSVEVERIELWGIDESGVFYRTSADQAPLGELCTFEPAAEGEAVALAWSDETDMGDGLSYVISAAGTAQWQEDPELILEDPASPRGAPYSCGWECNDPGNLVGSYALVDGATIPNARLADACGEEVDLWDFYGSYVVIDSAQTDCGPCRSMAEEEHNFLMQMRAEGIPVRVVTLLGDGLAEPYGTPSDATMNAWISDFDAEDPVLADEGWAYALLPAYFAATTGEDFGFPAWIVLNPQLQVIGGQVGFSTWDDQGETGAETPAEIIRADYSN